MNGVRWLLVGVVATMAMDAGSALVRKTGFTAGLEPKLLGRWFGYLARGRFEHDTILTTPPLPAELPVALLGHNLIGVTLALIFGAAVSALTPDRGPMPVGLTVALAIAYGLVTSALPWLIMFPSMGFGLLGQAGPADLLLFRTSLVNHAIYGAALGVFGRLLGAMR